MLDYSYVTVRGDGSFRIKDGAVELVAEALAHNDDEYESYVQAIRETLIGMLDEAVFELVAWVKYETPSGLLKLIREKVERRAAASRAA